MPNTSKKTLCLIFCLLALQAFTVCDDNNPNGDGGTDGDADADSDGDGDGDEVCEEDDDCDDGEFCNGEEQCDPGAEGADERGCLQSADGPCSDDERCDEETSRCVGDCDLEGDLDGDSHDSIVCGGDDCDDDDSNRYPGNPEICDSLNHDEDCDPITFGIRDADGDGEPDKLCCNEDPYGGEPYCGSDCDDTRGGVSPLVPEVCDGLDNDCDGDIDEGVLNTFTIDSDGDGFGSNAEGAATIEDCFVPEGYAEEATDCDDENGSVHPAASELCDDNEPPVDENCDDIANPESLCACEGVESRPCEADGVCEAGTEQCLDGRWGDCSIEPTEEVCDGVLDEDCDGLVDEGLTVACYTDNDNDTYPVEGSVAVDICAVSGRESFGGCPSGFTNRTPLGEDIDCNDNNSTLSPGGEEVCDGTFDEDCDGLVDEGLTVECYEDSDNDTYAPTGASATATCPSSDASRAPYGFCPIGLTSREPVVGETDCNDSSSMIHPSATEICISGDTPVDEDCDGEIDEGVSATCYLDADNDTFSPEGSGAVSLCNDLGRPVVGFCPINYTNRAPSDDTTTDCDDTRYIVNPDGTEVCDAASLDENCDGEGNPLCSCNGNETRNFCEEPGNCAFGTQQCQDGQWGECSISHQPETCDGEDDDCDGVIDNGVLLTCYTDIDRDDYAPGGAATTQACSCPDQTTSREPVAGDVDCDDSEELINPGMAELCDGLDNDCSTGGGNLPDEDIDGDEHTDPAYADCTGGYPRDDCDDDNEDVHPGQTIYFQTPYCETGYRWCEDFGHCEAATATYCAGPVAGETWDYDCDGDEDPAPPGDDFCWQGTCNGGLLCGTPHYYYDPLVPPACGADTPYYRCLCFGTTCSGESLRPLGCR